MMLYKGDCLQEMNKIADGSVDMILTSPPYGIGKEYDESVDLKEAVILASQKLKTDGVFCWQVGNRVRDGFIIPLDTLTYPYFVDLGFSLVNRIIWTFGHGAHCTKRFSGRYETVNIYAKTKNHAFDLDSVRVPQKYPNKKHYKGPKKGQLSGNPKGKNPGDVWDIVNVKNNHPEKTEHPCQFPEELCSRLIKAFTQKQNTILDPFMGSGSAGSACVNQNRQFIGIEQDDKYYEIAKKRIQEAEDACGLFK